MNNYYSVNVLWDLPDEETGEMIEDAAEAIVSVSVTDFGRSAVTAGPPSAWTPAEEMEFSILEVHVDEQILTDIDWDDLRDDTISKLTEAIELLIQEEEEESYMTDRIYDLWDGQDGY